MFDFKKFLTENWRDCDVLTRRLHQYGFREVTRDTAYKWWQRGSIPAPWFPVLLVILELERGKPTALAPYLVQRRIVDGQLV